MLCANFLNFHVFFQSVDNQPYLFSYGSAMFFSWESAMFFDSHFGSFKEAFWTLQKSVNRLLASEYQAFSGKTEGKGNFRLTTLQLEAQKKFLRVHFQGNFFENWDNPGQKLSRKDIFRNFFKKVRQSRSETFGKNHFPPLPHVNVAFLIKFQETTLTWGWGGPKTGFFITFSKFLSGIVSEIYYLRKFLDLGSTIMSTLCLVFFVTFEILRLVWGTF